jgi:hypothetical protein
MEDSLIKGWLVGFCMATLLIGVLVSTIPKAFIPGHGWKCTLWVNTRTEPVEQVCNQWSKE